MRRLISIVGLVLACAAAAEAAPFTTDLQTLRTTLDGRRTALAGLTDKTSKTRVKALNAAIKTLDRSKSQTTSGDVTTLASIARGIEKAYSVNDVDLETAFHALLLAETDFKAKVVADIAGVADATARGKLTTAVGKSDSFFGKASAPPSSMVTVALRAGSLKVGAKLLDSAALKVVKAIFACGPGQGDLFHAKINDVTDYDPPKINAYWQKFTSNGKTYVTGLNISGFNSGPVTIDKQVSFDIDGFYGVGTYPIHKLNTSGPSDAEGMYSQSLVFTTTDASGTLTVAYYDKRKGVIGGTFDATFTTHSFVGQGDKIETVKGVFRICSIQK